MKWTELKVRTKAALVAGAMAAAVAVPAAVGIGTGTAHAAYPVVSVQAGAAARNAPTTANSFVGWVLNVTDSGGASLGRQVAYVRCYADGGWANGNYASNRWFKVYVYESLHKWPHAQWLYVHSSYVTNQKAVGRC
ncbi:hypothetical protein [Gordonia sp. CPCC 205333]|uniref:hypothetical protein n=1 Tax=Gordonia sp. CPCC 205333 TaxID=3140790 RepID=UPI003AF3E3ED